MFMKVAFGAIAVGVIIMIAYLVIAQVDNLMPDESLVNDSNLTAAHGSAKVIFISGLGLLAIGVIVVAAFGLINVFK